jgi:DNA-binding MurR/RpiR family transcriptional regulator
LDLRRNPARAAKRRRSGASALRGETVAEIIRNGFERLTRAERQLANSLLENYPVSGLGGVTTVAEAAGVSTPTVVRAVKKLGFSGYPQFQASLRAELEATISSPIAKHDRWAAGAPDAHILNRFADAVMANLQKSLAQIDSAEFDAVAALLADRKRALHLVGGRITRSLADYLFTHLQVIREGATLIAPNANTWPHYVLNMKAGDVLIIFDIRRYEHGLLHLAEMARQRGVTVVLFTDQWGSPAARHAAHVINARIEVPSAWDSSAITLILVEALIAAVQSLTWEVTRDRIKELEGLFDQTRLFKKFV